MNDRPVQKSVHPSLFMILFLPFGISGGYVIVTLAWLLAHNNVSTLNTIETEANADTAAAANSVDNSLDAAGNAVSNAGNAVTNEAKADNVVANNAM